MDKINILWATANKDAVFNMLSMYAINSKTQGWWKHVNVILWGASVKLAGSDSQVQTEIMEMKNSGLTLEACQDCCETFGVSEKLKSLGIDVRYMGEPLTSYIKNGEKVLSL